MYASTKNKENMIDSSMKTPQNHNLNTEEDELRVDRRQTQAPPSQNLNTPANPNDKQDVDMFSQKIKTNPDI